LLFGTNCDGSISDPLQQSYLHFPHRPTSHVASRVLLEPRPNLSISYQSCFVTIVINPILYSIVTERTRGAPHASLGGLEPCASPPRPLIYAGLLAITGFCRVSPRLVHRARFCLFVLWDVIWCSLLQLQVTHVVTHPWSLLSRNHPEVSCDKPRPLRHNVFACGQRV